MTDNSFNAISSADNPFPILTETTDAPDANWAQDAFDKLKAADPHLTRTETFVNLIKILTNAVGDQPYTSAHMDLFNRVMAASQDPGEIFEAVPEEMVQAEHVRIMMIDFHDGLRDRPLLPGMVGTTVAYAAMWRDEMKTDETKALPIVQQINIGHLSKHFFNKASNTRRTHPAVVAETIMRDLEAGKIKALPSVIKTLNIGLERTPAYAALHRAKIACYRHMDEPRQAYRAACAWLSADPASPYAKKACEEIKQTRLSRIAEYRAEKRDRQLDDILAEAEWAMQNHKTRTAVLDYHSYLLARPDDHRVRGTYSSILRLSGCPLEAIHHAKRAFQGIHPDITSGTVTHYDPPASYHLCMSMLAVGMKREAAEMVSDLRASDPDNQVFRFLQSEIDWIAGYRDAEHDSELRDKHYRRSVNLVFGLLEEGLDPDYPFMHELAVINGITHGERLCRNIQQNGSITELGYYLKKTEAVINQNADIVQHVRRVNYAAAGMLELRFLHDTSGPLRGSHREMREQQYDILYPMIERELSHDSLHRNDAKRYRLFYDISCRLNDDKEDDFCHTLAAALPKDFRLRERYLASRARSEARWLAKNQPDRPDDDMVPRLRQRYAHSDLMR